MEVVNNTCTDCNGNMLVFPEIGEIADDLITITITMGELDELAKWCDVMLGMEFVIHPDYDPRGKPEFHPDYDIRITMRIYSPEQKAWVKLAWG